VGLRDRYQAICCAGVQTETSNQAGEKRMREHTGYHLLVVVAANGVRRSSDPTHALLTATRRPMTNGPNIPGTADRAAITIRRFGPGARESRDRAGGARGASAGAGGLRKKLTRLAIKADHARTRTKTRKIGSSKAQWKASKAIQPPNPATSIAAFANRAWVSGRALIDLIVRRATHW
jgi:hypothetical protein